METTFKSEIADYDSRKRHFALALLMTEIAPRLADVGFQECDICALADNTLFAQLEYRSHQICFFAEYALRTPFSDFQK
jgi:hypothetical protein